MRITAHKDQSAFIEFERREEDGYAIFDVRAELAGFRACNPGIILVRVPDFLCQLSEFERTRRGEAVIEGTEDFRLSIGALDTAGHIWTGFRISRQVYHLGGGRTLPLTLEGGFEYNSEFTNQLVRDFRVLLRGHQSA